MKTESISCNNCGAPLKVPGSAEYVTCNHCEAQLVIRRTDSVTLTEQVDKLTEMVDQLTQEKVQLEVRRKLDALDRAWQRERERYMQKDQQGNLHSPDEQVLYAYLLTFFGAVLLLGGGVLLFYALLGLADASSALAVIPGMVMTAAGVCWINYARKVASRYKRAYLSYCHQRVEIVRAAKASEENEKDDIPRIIEVKDPDF